MWQISRLKLLYFSGSVWPIEAFHPFVKTISYISPLTLPNAAITDIIIKGHGLTHPSVIKGLFVLVILSIVLMFAVFRVSRSKKYSRNTSNN
jgi:ABC-type polysaccharide/polyol phosphate export permease